MSPVVFTITVTKETLENCANSRLDVVLASVCDDLSRSAIVQRIKAGDSKVNTLVITKPKKEIFEGDVIELTMKAPPVLEVTPHPVDFEVIAEEEDFLIINKPAGLTVHHSSTKPEEITLVHGLLHRYPDFSNFESNERPGIVHRLDKKTSGLLLVARNPQAQAALSDLFRNRTIKKTYFALVKGHMKQEGSITFPIGRDPFQRNRMSARPGAIAPRESRTDYEVVEYLDNDSFIKLDLHTGRTHQIRVHCAALRHGLIGDEVYGKKSQRIARQALHAGRLSFTYKGKDYSFEAPLPGDMKNALDELRRGLSSC